MSTARNQQKVPAYTLNDVLDNVERKLVALRARELRQASEDEVYAIEQASDQLIRAIKAVSAEPADFQACAGSDDSNDVIEDTAVLLVEDNTINRIVAEEMLRKFRCRIDVATNGAEAVRQFQLASYDLIFMDCHMPVMDGFEAVAKIRGIESSRENENGANVQTPIVALTANALKGDRDKCLAAGMNDYVSKPFSLADLQGALERQLCEAKTTQIRKLATEYLERQGASSRDLKEDPPADAPSAIDTVVLDSIKRLTRTDGEQLLYKVVQIFLETSPRLFEQLESALADEDLAKIVESAHALRSCCGSVGAARLSEICATIEKEYARGNGAAAAEYPAQLRSRYKEAREELSSVLEATQQ